jgi:hypothetical protein
MKVKKGQVLVYRIFDIAEDIDLKKAETLLKNHRGPDKFKVPRHIDRALLVKNPPVKFDYGEEWLAFKGQSLRVETQAKLRDYGTLTLIYQIQIPENFMWFDLIQLASAIETGDEIDLLAEKHHQEIKSAIGEALKKPNMWKGFEDYIIYFIEDYEGVASIQEMISKVDIASLLFAESEVLVSERAKKNLLENVTQYGEKDLVLVEWNAALVIEPGGGREVCDILESAVSHLLELRYFDDILGDLLGKLYDDIERIQENRFIISNKFERLYKDASRRYIDFSEFVEKVENSFKVVGDFYLAIVYRSATRKFRLVDWQNNINRKMNLLAQASTFLQGEVNMLRSHLLEIVIILLIAYEVISAIVR